MTYSLDPLELDLIRTVAEHRQRQAAAGVSLVMLGVVASAAEYVVAQTMGLPWHAVLENTEGSCDVGDDIQVRATTYRHGSLIVHASDNSDHRFVLAIVNLYSALEPVTVKIDVDLIGWLPGHYAKHDRYWRDPGGNGRWAFFVPQADLRPMRQLWPAGASA